MSGGTLGVEYARDRLAENRRDGDRHRVPNLAHGLASHANKFIRVGESLKPGALANSEVPHATTFENDGRFSARYAVHAGLQRLRRPVAITAAVAGIDPRSGNA